MESTIACDRLGTRYLANLHRRVDSPQEWGHKQNPTRQAKRSPAAYHTRQRAMRLRASKMRSTQNNASSATCQKYANAGASAAGRCTGKTSSPPDLPAVFVV